MEIIKTNQQSNFTYVSNLYKNLKVLNGFNKLNEVLLSESVANDEINVQNILFENQINADLYLVYPLSVVVKTSIKFSSLHELINEIRKAYKEVYKDYNKYGIWGHDIYDLVIESISILEGPIVRVGIGS